MGYVGRGSVNNLLTENSGANLPQFKSFSEGLINYNVQVFTSSGTYTPTAGMVNCSITAIGGGGGGGGCGSVSVGGSAGAGGGGGGGYSYGLFTAALVAVFAPPPPPAP